MTAEQFEKIKALHEQRDILEDVIDSLASTIKIIKEIGSYDKMRFQVTGLGSKQEYFSITDKAAAKLIVKAIEETKDIEYNKLVKLLKQIAKIKVVE